MDLRYRLADPLDLARRLGLTDGAILQPGGLFVLCPAHAERTPSCSLTRGADGTVRVRCFGCDLSGDALTLVAAVNRLAARRDFPRVLERAASLAGTTLDKAPARRLAAPPPLPPTRPALPDDIFGAIAGALLSWGRLDGSTLVSDVELYLAGRRLLDDARAEGWGALPPPGESAACWARALVDIFGANAEQSGLLRKVGPGWAFTHPENRLLIPWRSPSGEIYTIQRRRLDDARGPGAQKYVFPAGRAARWPYGCERVTAGAPLAIVEGAFDVLALRRIAPVEGKEAWILGLAGTGCVEHAAKVPVGKVAIVALNSDDAGTAAIQGKTRKDGSRQQGLVEVLTRAGATRILRWNPAPSKDWGARLEAMT